MLRERMRRITSRQNPLVARYRAAARGRADDLLLLDGAHLVADALDAGVHLREAAVADVADVADAAGHAARRGEIRALAARLTEAGVEVVAASAAVMDALSPVRSASGIVALADRPSLDAGRMYGGGAPLVIVAVDVQDPGNLGAIVRVAEAGGATGLVAAGRSADPFGWKALRGSMGSALRIPVVVGEHADQAVADARRHGCRIVAAVPRGGRSLFDINLKVPAAVLIGGEGPGLPAALVDAADDRVTIPMQSPVESLNAAVTAALIVYEARRQRAATYKADFGIQISD
jgi:TrmH family RNA methyltransferase